MIKIIKTNNIITITGHAGYAPHGQDIVCSAVSALTQTFIASVEELTDDKIKHAIMAGNAFIKYGDLSKEARLLLGSFFVGLEMIANTYPDYVQIAQAWMA